MDSASAEYAKKEKGEIPRLSLPALRTGLLETDRRRNVTQPGERTFCQKVERAGWTMAMLYKATHL